MAPGAGTGAAIRLLTPATDWHRSREREATMEVLRQYYAIASHDSFDIMIVRDHHACWSEYKDASGRKDRTQSHLLPLNTDNDYLVRAINDALKDALHAIERRCGPVMAVTLTGRIA
jgi:hypothetical protein